MSAIAGTPEKVLSKVQEIFDEVCPGARCEHRDYGHKIGCGGAGLGHTIEEVVFARGGVTEEHARHQAEC